jgi:hypothetical protein
MDAFNSIDIASVLTAYDLHIGNGMNRQTAIAQVAMERNAPRATVERILGHMVAIEERMGDVTIITGYRPVR